MVGVLCGGLVDVKNVPAGEQVQVAVFGVGQCLQLIHVLEYGGAVAGLEVAEVDVKAACLQMLHVLAQAARGVVASEVGQVLFVAGEGGFCYQPAQALALAGELVDVLPEQGVGAGVARKDPCLATFVHGVAYGGHVVYGGYGFNGAAVGERNFAAYGDGDELDGGLLGDGQAGKVGPDVVVKDVLAQVAQDAVKRIHLQGREVFFMAVVAVAR